MISTLLYKFLTIAPFSLCWSAGGDAKDDAVLAEKYNIGTGFDVLLFSMIVRYPTLKDDDDSLSSMTFGN